MLTLNLPPSTLGFRHLVNIGSDQDFPQPLFEDVFHDLFPQNDAQPTLQQIFCKDFSVGIACLKHVGLPLDTHPLRLRHCAAVAFGFMMQSLKGLQPLLQDIGLETLPALLATGQRPPETLKSHLQTLWGDLRRQRNALEDLAEPTFLDFQELEKVLRRLHLVCALQSMHDALFVHFDTHTPHLRWQDVLRACMETNAAVHGRWVRYAEWRSRLGKDPIGSVWIPAQLNYRVFYNHQQSKSVRVRFVRKFLQIYEHLPLRQIH